MLLMLEGINREYCIEHQFGKGYKLTEVRKDVGVCVQQFSAFSAVVEHLLDRELADDEMFNLMQVNKTLRNIQNELKQLRQTAQTSFDQC